MKRDIFLKSWQINIQITTIFLFVFCPAILLAQPPQGKPLQVIAGVVSENEISDRIEALGTLQANESVTLSALVTEKVAKIHFNDGDVVEAGKLLVEMRSDEQVALMAEITSRVAEAKRQYDRVKSLGQGGSASASLIDERLREYETAKAQFSAVQSRLDDRRIVAPFSGKLGLRNISEGALVTPGTPIVTLDDLSVMKLDFSVPSTFLDVLKVGLSIEAQARGFQGEVFKGNVASIDSRIDPVTRSVVVRAIIPNPELKLLPGLLMSVDLMKNQRKALLIPEESIISEGPKKFVFVINDREGKKFLEKREIISGSRDRGYLEVISGVSNGEMIVVHGTVQAREGQEVTVSSIKRGDEPLTELLSQNQPPQQSNNQGSN